MQLDAAYLESVLTPVKTAANFYLGFSGGVDSHVLLHLCSKIAFCKHKVTAVYIDHGLQAESSDWARHCQQVAKQLAVKFLLINVDACAQKRQSPEEAARDARYQAFEGLIAENDVLLLAQHQEDQMETVLLQLFRGAGLSGLSAMPKSVPFAHGQLLRPLLGIDKQSILTYAQQQQLDWVEDPSNQRNDFDRNFLRNEIIPVLKQRWPSLEKTVSRSAEHCANAQDYLDEEAKACFNQVYDLSDQTVVIARLKRYNIFLQKMILRCWFKQQGLRMPSQSFVDAILQQVISASSDADPVLYGQGHEIRRYRDRLYCLEKQPVFDSSTQFQWLQIQQPLSLGSAGSLQIVAADSGFLLSELNAAKITVRFRQGGEKISLSGRQGRHQLKSLMQQAGIPPWQRQMIPLVYVGDELLAVGDQWISECYYHQQNHDCLRLEWQKIK